MVFFRPIKYFPSSLSLPLLKLIGRHKLCHNACDNLLQIRFNSLSYLQINHIPVDNVTVLHDLFLPVSKTSGEDIHRHSKLESHPSKSTQLSSVPDEKETLADIVKKSCNIQTHNVTDDHKIGRRQCTHNRRFILKRMSEDEFKNLFYNENKCSSETSCDNFNQTKPCYNSVSRDLKNSYIKDSLLQRHRNTITKIKTRFYCCKTDHSHVCRSRLPWIQPHQNHRRTRNGLLCSQTSGQYSSLRCASTISTQDKPWKILFFGTDNFAVEILRILNENRLSTAGSVVESLDVVSNPGKTCVRKYADRCSLDVYTWPTDTLAKDYDVGILASFGHLIPAKLINAFPHGIINIHPSLLPRWRGSAPIIHAILNGDEVTGVSIMKLRPKRFDIGSLLAQKELLIPTRIMCYELGYFLAKQGGQMMIECLSNMTSFEKSEFEQSKEGLILAPKLKPSMANIRWNEQTCVQIHRQYRAVSEMMSLKSHWNGMTVKLLDMVDPVLVNDIVNKPTYGVPISAVSGTPVYSKKRQLLLIKCKDGWIGFRTIIIKKTMSAKAFYNGYLSKPQNKDTIFS